MMLAQIGTNPSQHPGLGIPGIHRGHTVFRILIHAEIIEIFYLLSEPTLCAGCTDHTVTVLSLG